MAKVLDLFLAIEKQKFVLLEVLEDPFKINEVRSVGVCYYSNSLDGE